MDKQYEPPLLWEEGQGLNMGIQRIPFYRHEHKMFPQEGTKIFNLRGKGTPV